MSINSTEIHPHGDILIVDNTSNLKTLTDILTVTGYQVRSATDGESALRSVEDKQPELILLDYKMAGMNGIEVCRRLKVDPETRDIPVIFISAHGDIDLKVDALEAGGIDYVIKPVNPPELLAKIDNHLKLFRLQKRLALQTEALTQEIEERKRLEKKNVHLSLLLDGSLNEIFIFHSETLRFIDVNLAARTNLGYSMEELQNMTPLDYNLEFTDEMFAELVAPLRSGAKQKIIFTTARRRKNGTFYPVEVHLQLMPEEPPVFFAISLDISDRQKAEQRYQELVEGTTDLITQVNAEGNFLYSNHKGKEIFGHDPEQLIGKNAFGFVHPDDREKTTVWFDNCLNRHLLQAGIENRQINQETGAVYDLLWTINFHYDNLGDLISVNGIARDITEQKKRGKQLLLDEKLVTIAGLAAGVAHEINTPLSAILQAHQLVEMGLSPEDANSREKAARYNVDLVRVQEYFRDNELDFFMDGIRESALTAGKIIKSLLEFSSPHKGSFSSVNLKGIVENALLLSRTDYNMKKQYGIANIKIVKEYSPDLSPVICVGTEIERVILNLIKNSVQSLFSADLKEKPRIILRITANNTNAVVEVEDNGPGIPEEVKKHIFDPFFTTRDVGTGTGLGLSVVHAIIVDKHKGEIRVESEPGKGAKFIVELPLHQAG